MPAGHRLAGTARTTPMRLSELAKETWIAGCPQCRGHPVDACADAGFHPDIAYATENPGAVAGPLAGLSPPITDAWEISPRVTLGNPDSRLASKVPCSASRA
ncbi:LysR substrate-binding domain-containing protein [Nocardia sp. NPDC059236]|uniref:LysR substrate-binding domain-containing protein n=1 Tax=Nocardia sp. NPDC059236 TaxID=3346783 RepID=UPI0036B19BA0